MDGCEWTYCIHRCGCGAACTGVRGTHDGRTLEGLQSKKDLTLSVLAKVGKVR